MSANTVETDATNESQSDIPEWLNATFLEEHLRSHYKNNEIEVTKFEAHPTGGRGENFASSLYRVEVTFNTAKSGSTAENSISTVNLIVKRAIDDEVSLNALLQFDAYDKEIVFYTEIAPKINQKLKELDEAELLAESFGACKMQKVLILEDLHEKGYHVMTPSHGLNFAETKAVLKRVATFHAICAVLQEEKPDIFADFKYGHMSRETNGFNNVYTQHTDIIIDIMSEWPEFDAYVAKIKRLRGEIIERGRQTFDLNPDHFNTLNHDDLWSTNLMIKPDHDSVENAFENIVLIDFQFSYWGSPATDLYYFLNSSICEALRPHRITELVEFYHYHLASYLTQLNYKKTIPTWDEFYEQYRERKFYAFIISCLVQPMMINNTEKIGAEDLILDNEKATKAKWSLYQGETIRNNLRKLIPFYNSIGMFD